ncbi:LLM class flavin-dependent oxidoreductase [Diaminobutyricimonas sp. TR449]|uniref:LLM class flavin-dependent oxidoreductase n=1 Tax=Diaminobutyricimonas sp. TR449 TaxID=2708076 RepID=UPI001423EAAD|nr:LLM class flavin-dependent oxidoreductase [Diaminobutyricimonas sp. TR449]
MSYRHALQFGTSITTADLAELSERRGFDSVSIETDDQLDQWTLLSWIAARTARIRLSAALPVPEFPAVLARKSASLDLLSDGRLELAFRGDDSEAVAETLDVVRAMWNVDDARLLRYNGDHFRVGGAERGPAPAHDVPIHLAGDDPQTLQLAGRDADGWLTTVTAPEQLRAANAAIDAAARELGRDPREIRRMVTVTDPAIDLAPLLAEGVSGFFLRTDDPAAIEAFAREVIPTLRAAAPEAERVPRRSAARAKRRPGIDYDGLPAALADIAVEPGDTVYSRTRSTYLRGGSPGLVLQTRNTADVVAALAFARDHRHVPLSLRSGGHGISGRSTNDGGIVISLAAMNDIEVLDEGSRLVRIGPGARWQDVAAALEPHGLAISSGDFGGVGVGGLATTGGIGFLGRNHGLAIDHLRAVDLVLADGSEVHASDTENPELFWAVRGAGANFGIVTAFEFEAAVVPAVGWAQLVFVVDDTADFLMRWGATQESAPRQTTSFLLMGAPRPDQPMIAQLSAMVDSDDPDTIIAQLQPFADIAPLYQQSVQLLPYAAALLKAQDVAHQGRGEPVSRSGLTRHITPEFAEATARFVRSGVTQFFQIRATGGAASDIAPDATAYAHRDANFAISAMGSNRAWLNAAWDSLYPFMDGLYLSFETERGPEQLEDAFTPMTLARLRELKARFDPDNLFNDNFPIAPALAEEAAS